MSSDSDSEYTDAGLSDSEDVYSPELKRCVGCCFEMFPGDLDKDSGLCFSCKRTHPSDRATSSTKPNGLSQHKDISAQGPASAVTVTEQRPAEDRAPVPRPVLDGAQEPRPVEDGAPAPITAEGVTPAPRPAETLFEADMPVTDDDDELERQRIDKASRELELQRISAAPNQTAGPLNASDLVKKVRVLQLFSVIMLSYYFNVECIYFNYRIPGVPVQCCKDFREYRKAKALYH